MNGGIVLFLCANSLTSPAAAPAGTPACPANGGTVTGTLTASNITPVLTQGIETGPAEFAEILHAIRSGVTYANVHSSPNHVGGEIRGRGRGRKVAQSRQFPEGTRRRRHAEEPRRRVAGLPPILDAALGPPDQDM